MGIILAVEMELRGREKVVYSVGSKEHAEVSFELSEEVAACYVSLVSLQQH